MKGWCCRAERKWCGGGEGEFEMTGGVGDRGEVSVRSVGGNCGGGNGAAGGVLNLAGELGSALRVEIEDECQDPQRECAEAKALSCHRRLRAEIRLTLLCG